MMTDTKTEIINGEEVKYFYAGIITYIYNGQHYYSLKEVSKATYKAKCKKESMEDHSEYIKAPYEDMILAG